MLIHTKGRMTSTPGYNVIFEQDITKQGMVSLCLDLNQEFESEGYTFEPEPGGFIFFSNYETAAYKSMRLSLRQDCWFCKDAGTWPDVPADVMTSWRQDASVIYKRHHETSEDTYEFRKRFPLSPAKNKHARTRNASLTRRMMEREERDAERGARLGRGKASTKAKFRVQGHGTVLRSYYDAPGWTRGELDRFGRIFEKYGIYHMDTLGLRSGEHVIPA